jgi:hypothetical protein
LLHRRIPDRQVARDELLICSPSLWFKRVRRSQTVPFERAALR